MGKIKNTKPVLFLSHVNEDAEIAKRIKEWLDSKLAKSINVFVSSDKKESMPGGSSWWDEVRTNLRRSKVMVALITQRSKDRSWIYFEAGGAYFQNIPVIPVLLGVSKKEITSAFMQITYYDFSIDNEFKDFCANILQLYDLSTNLYDALLIDEFHSLDKKISSQQSINTIEHENISVHTERNISDDDALNILESWMGKRPASENTKVMYYVDIDRELNLPSGTAKRLIIKAAERWSYEPVRQAEETILFKEKLSQAIYRNPITGW